jgi:signal transduction histidine kinase
LDALYLTVVPVLLASVTFRVWATAALAFGNLVLLSFVLTWNDAAADPPDPGSELVLIALAFLSTLVAVVSSMMLDGDRRRIIKANHDLEESKRTQMQMLNNVAHDLASPLTPIRIQMYLLARGASQDQVQTAVGIVQRNVDHLDRLVHDLKDMAKAEAGMLRIHPHAVDLETVVKTAVASLVAQASLKSVTLDVVTDGPLPLKADAQRLTQVLYNLIGNAVKFTPPEGRVVVRAGRHRGSARVDVVDTGRGLTAEEAAQLFRPFVQVHDPSEVKDKGTGLGLFISKQLVEAHGGRIWVESPGRGQGATFAFELPMSGVEPTRTA